jgi:branched-chain amino acid transport system substrate-binding protein
MEGLTRRALATVVALTLAVAMTACSSDDDDAGGAGAGNTDDTADPSQVDDLLGPVDQAAGEPVKVGLVSDGQAPTFDARLEVFAAEATVAFWNEHRGGIAGRPIELVTCETAGDPAKGIDCGNQMIEQDVVAVLVGQSTVPEAIWEPLHEAAMPTMFFQTNGEQILTDPTSFVISNPYTTAFGLPISVAEDSGADKVAFVTIDVPVATSLFESLGPPIMDKAGLDYEIVAVPVGTADMTSQMQEIVDGGVGVVQLVGPDAFCVSAIQGLAALGYAGEITEVSQCVTDALREAVGGDQLEGTYVTSGVPVGAGDDPSYQLYQAVMSSYGGENVTDIDNNVPMVGYTITGALATALQDITGDIDPATVTAAIKAMPESELPGGGGTTFQCGGSAMASRPAMCSNQWLRTALDAEGQPTDYEAVDSTDILEGV